MMSKSSSMSRPRKPVDEVELRIALERGRHISDIAAAFECSTRTIARRVDALKKRYGEAWGAPEPRVAVTIELDQALDEGALRRIARLAIARGAEANSTREDRDRARLGLEILASTNLGLTDGEAPKRVRDTADILAALERGGRVLPADPVH